MSTDRVTDKIRKLLAMANDQRGNDQERETALRQAHALLVKHNMDVADIGDTNAPQEVREQHQVRLSVYPWARGIAHSIAELFFCSYFFQRGAGKSAHHSFVGKQSNALTAAGMAEYVVNSVFKELRQRFGSDTAPEARSFAMGVDSMVRQRCREMRQQAERENTGSTGRALALVNVYKAEDAANKAWIAANVGGLKAGKDLTKRVQGAAYYEGREHGKSINLARQLGTSASSGLKRLAR